MERKIPARKGLKPKAGRPIESEIQGFSRGIYLKNADAVRTFLSRYANACAKGDFPPERLKALSGACNTILTAIIQGKSEERIAKLEKRVKKLLEKRAEKIQSESASANADADAQSADAQSGSET